jgi:Microsomal signal peptidase 25 kDa subunit (SPC25)
MNKPVTDPTKPYRTLIAQYTEAIRSSDFKANIAFLFVAFMMGSVLWNYTGFPSYLPVQIVLLPFLVVYFCLFMVLLPRYPKRGAKTFLVARNVTPADIESMAETERELEQLKLTCAVLSDILWWKTQYIRVSFLVAILCVFLTIILLFYVWYT